MTPRSFLAPGTALSLVAILSACSSSRVAPTPDAPPDSPLAESPPPDSPGAEDPAGPSPTPPGVACTKDAKVCPDGSTVGRSGPSCAFAPCPGEAGGSAPPGEPPRGGSCKDLCGNGTCEEMVCMAVGCPCAETKASCPKDCK